MANIEQITIDKAYYEFLVEKAKERCELYSENRFLRYKLKEKEESAPIEMTREDWLVYKDFIANNWFPLCDSDKADEIKLAAIMYNRSDKQREAFATFRAEMEGSRQG